MKKLFVTLLLGLSYWWVNAQNVLTATGGNGAYKNSIRWLNFSGLGEIAAGGTITRNFTVGDVTVYTSISNVAFTGALDGHTISSQRIVPYRSGTWPGDGLVKLYNIGVPNNGATAADRSQNQLYNALGLKYDGVDPLNCKTTFTIKIYATVNGQPMDLGLVYASAEDDNVANPSNGGMEYSKGTTNGTVWQLLEKNVPLTSFHQQITFSNNNLTAQTSCGSDESGEPGATAILFTKKGATTVSAPLSVDIETLSAGKSAIALGIVLNNDIGDAPSSYGTPANIFFAEASGGNPSASVGTFTNYLSSGTGGGTPVIASGILVDPPKSRIGLIGGDNDPQDDASQHSAFANIDDNANTDDEDGLSVIGSLNVNTGSYSISFPVTATSTNAAFVSAWIDLNHNGIFEATEYKSQTIAANTVDQTITLSWTGLTPALLRSGISYIRLRVSLYNSAANDNITTAVDERATMALSGGETEDYRLEITSTISGNLFNDANALIGSPVNTVDGTLISSASGTQQYVSLIDLTSNTIIQTVPVVNGAYAFTGPYNGNYSMSIVNTVSGATSSSTLPSGWLYTGEYQGLNAGSGGSDGNPNGNLTVVSTGQDTYTKFGIERRPETNNQLLNINSNVLAGTLYSLPSLIDLSSDPAIPQLSGSDAEDKPASPTDSISNGGTFVITTLPPATLAILYYDNTPIGAGVVITNYDPAKLQIEFKSGTMTTTFQYALTDAAGMRDISPATYQINLLGLLPATGMALSAHKVNEKLLLKWQTIPEDNTVRFNIEQSTDGINYTTIGTVEAAGNSNAVQEYSFSLTMPNLTATYFRVSLINKDGKINFSNVVRTGIINNMSLSPNPAGSNVVVSGLTGNNNISIYGMDGKPLQNLQATGPIKTIYTGNLAKGMYWVKVAQQAGTIKILKLIKE